MLAQVACNLLASEDRLIGPTEVRGYGASEGTKMDDDM